MSELDKEIEELKDNHVIEKLKLLQYIDDNTDEDIEPAVECFVKEDMMKTWKSIANNAQDKSMDTLVKILWETMCRGAGFEFEVEKSDNGIQIKCSYCPYVDLAKKAGSLKMGYRVYCASDDYIVAGFNDKIGFKRTKTLMEGHDCCDHFYYLK